MRTLFILMLCVVTKTAYSQNFDENFEDKTLRIDYIFSGNKSSQEI